MDYPNEILTFILGLIGVLSFTTGFFKWKLSQIENDIKRRVTTSHNTDDNHNRLNGLSERQIRSETKSSDHERRISTLEGAFDQHTKESKK